MSAKNKTKESKVVHPEPTFPDEVYLFEDRVIRRYMGYRKELRVSKDLLTLGTARGRRVGVYKRVKEVTAIKKTVVSTDVKEV